jgi:hypothetical protein
MARKAFVLNCGEKTLPGIESKDDGPRSGVGVMKDRGRHRAGLGFTTIREPLSSIPVR